MRSHLVALVAAASVIVSCAKSPDESRRYTLQGQVIAIAADQQEATIKHDAINGLMPAMTMPYKVREPNLLKGLVPGDVIAARLVIVSNDAYLTEVKKVGEAPLDKPRAEAPAPPASSAFELLKPGQAVPDATFVDQDEKRRTFGSFAGEPVVVSFTYTNCPLPTFCPLIDRHFATLQQRLREDPTLNGRVRLISVSFDPATDTPAVLKNHARILQADPKVWTFLTGKRDDVERFAARFGVSIARAPNDARDITHNLRTAIVGADGRLVKVYTGNEWTPDQVIADLHGIRG